MSWACCNAANRLTGLDECTEVQYWLDWWIAEFFHHVALLVDLFLDLEWHFLPPFLQRTSVDSLLHLTGGQLHPEWQ